MSAIRPRVRLASSLLGVALAFCGVLATHAAPPSWRTQEIDAEVAIGYGLAIGDVDGDGKLDILLADQREIVWYANPDWKRRVIVADLTPQDNVCIAARDLDGDGKVEVAAGAGWAPSNTVDSGSVHYLVAPADRSQKWRRVDLPNEPTVHRMRWAHDGAGGWDLLVQPLHGRGNRNGVGAGARLLAYRWSSDVDGEWKTSLVDETLHFSHNLEILQWDEDPAEEVLVCGKEGLLVLDRSADGWKRTELVSAQSVEGFAGASEIRTGLLPGGRRFLATIEPFHGHQAVVYLAPATTEKPWTRRVLAADLAGGHAVECVDVLGSKSDQLIVGWRLPDARGRVGVRLLVPGPGGEGEWSASAIDDGGMACEDLEVADLDGDGDLDVVAAGRATHNVRIYWNER